MATGLAATTTQAPSHAAINHPSQIVISENLKQAAIDHISYLQEYHDHPECLQKQAREYAVYRYETFWLPFLAENADVDILPPIDIHFVWHAHMLAPTAYASDCERIFGRILPSQIRTRTQQIIRFSEQLWTKRYNRTMPYHLDYSTNIQVIPPYTSKIKYALSQAIERQSEFYYNVALAHYQDSTFLDDAIARYRKFIYLKRLNPQLFVVPMYDIDLIWHTHQLFPESYRRDMIANLQHVLHHDDTTQDRSTNSKLSTADHETRHKWFELYGDRLPKNGCMYRGKSSKDLFVYVNDFKFLIECQRYALYVQFNDQQASTTDNRKTDKTDKITTVVPLHDHSSSEPVREQFFAQFNSSEQELFARGSSGSIEAHFEADYNDLSTQLVLKIQQKAGYWPINYFSSIVEYQIPSDKLQRILEYTEPVTAANSATGDSNPNDLYHVFDHPIEHDSPLLRVAPNAKQLIIGIPAVDINTIIVRYELSEYQDVILDQNYVSQLGPTFLFNLENIKVQQGLHSILPLHQDDPLLLNIRHTVINDIDIFTATYNASLFASCHTLNWSQLPLPNQVSTNHNVSVVTLDPDIEEAFIIKDYTGDWGIVKFSKKLFTSALDGAEDDKSYQFSLYRFLSDGRTEEEIVYVDWEDDKWLIGSNNFGIEMNTWSISVKRNEIKNSIQYICLGAALISRFDVLFTEIFGQHSEAQVNNQPNGNHVNNDVLANDIGKLKLNGSHQVQDAKSISSEKKINTTTSNI